MFHESLLQMVVWSIFKMRVSLFLFSKHIVGEVVKLVSAFMFLSGMCTEFWVHAVIIVYSILEFVDVTNINQTPKVGCSA